MDFYMKIELFRNGVPSGKGVTVYDADNLVDALRKASAMVGYHPNTLRSQPPSVDLEERITIGAVLSHPA